MTIPWEALMLAADVQENVQTLTSGMTVGQVVALGCIVTVSVLALLGSVSWMIRTQAATDAKFTEQRMKTYEKSIETLQASINELNGTVTHLSQKIVGSDILNSMIRVIVVEEVNKAMTTYNAIHDGK